MDYTKTAKEILTEVGGEENIVSVVHCYTRLRFTLKDESFIEDKKVEDIDGVLGIMKSGGLYQVIIGNDVAKCYKELMKITNLDDDDSKQPEGKKEKQNIINRFFNMISGCMAPVLPALIAGGMMKVVQLIIVMLDILPEESQSYRLFTAIGDAPFFFLPILLAASSARYFKVSQTLAVAVIGVLVYPDFITMMGEESVHFFGIPVTAASYSYSVIPVLLIVWAMSYIEPFVDRIVPTVAKNFLSPLLVLLISAPLAFIVLGPIGAIASNYFTDALMFIYDTTGVLAVVLLSAFMPLIVLTGMHQAFTPIILSSITTLGFDPLILVAQLASNLSQGGASLAVGMKSKVKKQKQIAYSAAFSALLGGITEPAMYGVTVKLKKPMIACIISGGLVGLFTGLFQLKTYVMATPGLISIGEFLGGVGNKNIIVAVIASGLAIVLSFALTWIIGFDEKEAEVETTNKQQSNIAATSKTAEKELAVDSPVSGTFVPLTEVKDSTFSKKLIGDGIAIYPDQNKIVAPFDGEIEAFFDSKHAIGLKSDDGIEILIHVGLETVNLNGQYFTGHVKKGDRVKKGDVLLTFDRKAIQEAGFDIVTPIIVTNSDDFNVTIPTLNHISKFDEIIYVSKANNALVG